MIKSNHDYWLGLSVFIVEDIHCCEQHIGNVAPDIIGEVAEIGNTSVDFVQGKWNQSQFGNSLFEKYNNKR